MSWRRMARSRSILRRLHRFARLGSARRALLIEAAFRLFCARLALMAVPFPRLARRIGEFVPPSDIRVLAAARPGDPRQADLARHVGWAVRRAAHHLPFEAVCLPQAMAARAMLKRRRVASAMHFGAARRDEKPLDAHAWLNAAGVEVTGYPVGKDLAEIACFV